MPFKTGRVFCNRSKSPDLPGVPPQTMADDRFFFYQFLFDLHNTKFTKLNSTYNNYYLYSTNNTYYAYINPMLTRVKNRCINRHT